MSYIGKEPQTGAYSMLDNLTASATASYSLTLDSVAFVPESANHLIVSLNGVIQKAGSSFTVSSSTLTFSSALTSSDSIDFVLALGNVLDVGVPSDSTVTNAKTNFVSTSSAAGLQIKGDGTTDGTLQLNCSQNSHGIKLKSPAHSAGASYTLTFPDDDGDNGEVLTTNGSGVLTWESAGGGITMADQWRVTTGFTGNANPISSNWEREDVAPALSYFGSQMTESSGVFTFPSTGIYMVHFYAGFKLNGDSRYNSCYIRGTTDGSTLINVAEANTHITRNSGSTTYAHAFISTILDIQNTSNNKVAFQIDLDSTGTEILGNTARTTTGARFIRLGDT